MDAAQKSTGRAELFWFADPPHCDLARPVGEHLVIRTCLLFRLCLHDLPDAIRVERPGKEVVDRDAVRRDLAREPGNETRQARASPVRQSEDRDWCFHGA